jgi:hypothetical protein
MKNPNTEYGSWFRNEHRRNKLSADITPKDRMEVGVNSNGRKYTQSRNNKIRRNLHLRKIIGVMEKKRDT